MSKDVYIGLDIATSSMRAVAINQNGGALARASAALANVVIGSDQSVTQESSSWIAALDLVLGQLGRQLKQKELAAKSLLISATSGTFVICDDKYAPVDQAVMYNDGRAADPLGRAAKVISKSKKEGSYYFANTPEFVIAYLSGIPLNEIPADTSHSLKIGLDLSSSTYLASSRQRADSLNLTLPKLVLPGVKIATISKERSQVLGLPMIPIYAGMTDGCTAQIAAGGYAGSVTSLGTTMVIKVVADKDISGAGFYSHLLPKAKYLVGGASNIGGISYQKYAAELEKYNDEAEKLGPANVVCYPLPTVGERFPIKSATLKNLISSEPENDLMAYRMILEGLAFTEKYAYDLLEKAGAKISPTIFTSGGGGKSKVLSQIRATVLNKPVVITDTTGSDMGAAYLAKAAFENTGDLSLALAQINISDGQIFQPIPAQREALNNNYQKYLALIAPYI